MGVMHIIKIYSGYDSAKQCEYRTQLDSRDYETLDELLDEIGREILDNEETLGEQDDTN
jgi:hypothetical protein